MDLDGVGSGQRHHGWWLRPPLFPRPDLDAGACSRRWRDTPNRLGAGRWDDGQVFRAPAGPVRNPVRILIADDHQLFAEGLSSGLSTRFEICGISSTADDVLRAVIQLKPDVLLLDVGLGRTNGLKLIGPLLSARPSLRIVVVTMHSDRLLAQTAFRAGAHAFVPKDSGIPDLCLAIDAAARGEQYLSADVPSQPKGDGNLSLAVGLTPRQREVTLMIGDGLSSAAIAARLSISVPTVTFHRQQIRKALGLKSEWELLRYAILVRGNVREGSSDR